MTDKRDTTPGVKPDLSLTRWDDISDTRRVSVVPLEGEERDATPCLIVIAGKQIGRIFRLTAPETRIGRANEADLCIRDESVSRFHAMVRIGEDGVCRVQDLNSTNGTFINGTQIADGTLSDGDRIQIGRQTILKLEFHSRLENEFHEQLYEAGTRDSLTEVFNRRYLDQHLEADFRLALRHQEEISVLIIDVDGFKQINDTLGHLAGDAALRALARLFTSRVRQEDLLARYGGDEFVIVLRRTSAEGAWALAESLRRLAEEMTFLFQEKPVQARISIGVATLTHPSPYAAAVDLLAAADDALSRAKQLGRNRVESAVERVPDL